MNATQRVLVVGGGPVGLALAGELGWRDILCTLIEKGDGRVVQPKMDFVGVRTMEFCRRWGIVPWVHEAGYNRAYPQDCAWVSSLNGYEFGREVFAPLKDEPRLPQSTYSRGERCPQNFFDPVLSRFASSFPTVTIRRETELLRFEDDGTRVTARLKDLRSGAEDTVEAAYLVGCDGGASTVREALGIPMQGSPVLTYTTNCIFRCENLEALHDKKPGYRFIFIGPEGTWATMVAINGRDQWRFSLVGDDTRRQPGEAEMRAAIVKAVGREFDFEILSIMPWVRRQLVADGYGKGRVFIAGDAAHLTSPTGGFGMNMGIQDSVDLGWKLEAVLQGWGGPELLQSYEVERRPVAIRNVNEATGNLKRMLAPRDAKPSPAVFEPGPEGDQARKEFGDRYTEMMRREWYTPGIHLGFVYESSPVIVPDGTPPPPDEVSTYTQTARPGSRAPHVWLAEDRSTLDLFGRGFVLLVFGEGDAPALVEAAEGGGLPLTVHRIDNRAAAELYARHFVLVRPDGHVAWRSDQAPDASEAARIVSVVRGCGAGAMRQAAA
ncbi:FAD-dependent monooxygenase [Pararoseomonas indoligenes]|uniref:FAD-dependent monooxygenase n=1 Tax=Roseomonas indoligenes TaxID=2820811 RepID=A0A940SA23_9PROT|nr:FAD-dependent monooxygenase [Pararoseomonas indoligenes]MBP0495898.1 FAD-dependent monooxygenase [Pararoseomonas indoligenes]